MRKSYFYGVSAIFFQYCFMSETQVLMTVSDFFFLGIISWKGALLFNGMGEGFIFNWGGGGYLMGASVLMGGFQKKKKIMDGGHPLNLPLPPTMGYPEGVLVIIQDEAWWWRWVGQKGVILAWSDYWTAQQW